MRTGTGGLAAAAIGIVAAVACAPAAPNVDAGWPCPTDWVRLRVGGCAPGVFACRARGPAAAGACDGVDWSRARMVPQSDGGVATSFVLRADGVVNGAWPQDGDPDGPPALDWTPDAGIPTCPATWMRLPDGTCDPRVRTDCPAGAGAIPGGTCTRTATVDCPTDEFPDVTMEAGGDPVLHVREGADVATADGSRARPFARIADAVTSAGASASVWIALAAGRYAESLALARGNTHIVGVCSARVAWVPPTGDVAVRVSGAATVLDLRTVTVRGGTNSLTLADGARATLRSLRLTEALSRAILVTGAGTDVAMQDVTIDDTRPGMEGFRGRALQVEFGAHCDAVRLSIDRASDTAVAAYNAGSQLALRDVLVRNTRAVTIDGVVQNGQGLGVATGAHVTAANLVLDANLDAGAFVQDMGSILTLADAIVRQTRGRANEHNGMGLYALSGGHLDAQRVLVEGNDVFGAAAFNDGADLTLAFAIVRGTLALERNTGRGLFASGAASIHAHNVVVTDNLTMGVSAEGTDARVDVADSIISRTRPSPAAELGAGVYVLGGATVRVDRTRITANSAVGAAAVEPGATLRIERSVVANNGGATRAGDGWGVVAQLGGRLDVLATRIENNVGVGLFASGVDARVTGDGVVVAGTRARTMTPLLGIGVQVSVGARGVLRRMRIESNASAGVLVTSQRATLQLEDALIARQASDAAGVSAQGLSVSAGGQASVFRTWIRGVSQSGVLATGASSTVALTDVGIESIAMVDAAFGVGLMVSDGARGDLARVIVRDVFGSGIVATSRSPSGTSSQPSTLNATDLFIGGVRSTVIDPNGDLRVAAYGIHARDGSAVEFDRVVVDDAGYGFFSRSAALSIRGGVLSHLLDAAGAYELGTSAPPLLREVLFVENARQEILSDARLPSAASLATPSPVCEIAACP